MQYAVKYYWLMHRTILISFAFLQKTIKTHNGHHNNEAWTMARKISLMLWNYFEPKDKWEPPTIRIISIVGKLINSLYKPVPSYK